MPGPEEWGEEDFEKAKTLLQSGKGSAQQRERLMAGVDAYAERTGATFDLPIVSRETRSGTPDPLKAYEAETAAIAPAPEPDPGREPVSRTETALDSFANGINLGMGDALGAVEGLNALGEDPSRVNEVAEGMRARRNQGQEQHPTLAAFSEGVGAVMSPGAKAAGVAGRALGAAPGFGGKAGRAYELGMGGAAEGAAAGAGLADEGEGVHDASVGWLGGAAAGPLAAFALEPLGRAAGRKAKELTGRAVGPGKADLEQMMRSGGPDAVERFGGSIEKTGINTQRKAWEAIQSSGAQIGRLSQAARAPVNLSGAGEALVIEADNLASIGDPQAMAMARDLMGHADAIGNAPDRSYAQAHELRKFLDDLIYKINEGGPKDTPVSARLRRGVGMIRQAMDNAAAQEGPEFHAAMTEANEIYSTAKKVFDYSTGQRAGEMAQDTNLTGNAAAASAGFFMGGPAGAAIAPAIGRGIASSATRASVLAPTLRQLAAFTDVSGAGLALPWLQPEEQ